MKVARRLAVRLAHAVPLAGLAVGLAHAAPDFPASSGEADILRWVSARTSIARGAILAVSPQAVIALERETGAGQGIISAEVREELIGADVASKAQARSVLISLELDCSARRFRILGRTLFGLPDLQGTARNEAGLQTWTTVEPAAPIGKAWQAGCDTGFVFPYAGPGRVQTAAASRVAATPAAPAEGAYQVVLGSFTVAGNAQVAADRLDHGFADALAGRRPRIRPATIGGKAYSVVTVAAFASAGEASDFCGRIRTSKLECSVRKLDAKPPA